MQDEARHADNRVAERNRDTRVPCKTLGAKNRVAESPLQALASVIEVNLEALERQLFEQILLAGLAQRAHQLVIEIEVILNGVLSPAGDKKDLFDAGGDQLLDDVLPR